MNAAVFVFVLSVVACLIAHVGILHSVVRSRGQAADMNVPRPRLGVEIVWALIPAIALAFVLTATWARVKDRPAPLPGETMRIAR